MWHILDGVLLYKIKTLRSNIREFQVCMGCALLWYIIAS